MSENHPMSFKPTAEVRPDFHEFTQCHREPSPRPPKTSFGAPSAAFEGRSGLSQDVFGRILPPRTKPIGQCRINVDWKLAIWGSRNKDIRLMKCLTIMLIAALGVIGITLLFIAGIRTIFTDVLAEHFSAITYGFLTAGMIALFAMFVTKSRIRMPSAAILWLGLPYAIGAFAVAATLQFFFADLPHFKRLHDEQPALCREAEQAPTFDKPDERSQDELWNDADNNANEAAQIWYLPLGYVPHCVKPA